MGPKKVAKSAPVVAKVAVAQSPKKGGAASIESCDNGGSIEACKS